MEQTAVPDCEADMNNRAGAHGRWTKLNWLMLAGIILLILGLCYLGRENRRLTGLRQPPVPRPPIATEEPAAIFFVETTPTAFSLKPVLCSLPGKGDRHVRALEVLFAGPPSNAGLQGFFSKGTRVLGFTLKNGLATVNLNQEATRINVGSQGEALAIASIVNTLTKFPDVYRVQLLIEGKEVESLAGHVDTTGTFPYNDQVVDPVPVH